MIKRFSLLDPIFNEKSHHSELNIEKVNNPTLNIFRLLSGTCKIYDEFYEKTYHQKTNYFILPYSEQKTYKQDNIKNLISDEVNISDYSRYFALASGRNKDFYEPIETEVLNCLVARKKGHYLESFIFLYRILEGISYSIPLIYTSRSSSFTKSFKALQKFIPKNSKDGEIAFFKKFLSEAFKDEDFYKSSIDIKLDEIPNEDLRSAYFNIYKDKIKSACDESCITSEIEDEEISLTFKGFFEFLIEIRNRYFHFLQGTWQENIATNQIVHPDFFFKPLIDQGINWIATIFLEIMKFDFEK
ncbi:hypothetical protein [Oceanisphaera sp. KMM 10153]|uniref:hypothetical protein n=1 Tax=Oceanisphaera submarina TaxID=3390193 RepID=UPI0039751A04